MMLNDVGEQVVNKTRQLNIKTGNLVDYGMNDLEPWRKNVSLAIEQALTGMKNLEHQADMTYNGCAEMERRINILSYYHKNALISFFFL